MKPSLNLLLFTSQLTRSLGFRGTVLPSINFAKILRAVALAFGRLAAVEARLEGKYDLVSDASGETAKKPRECSTTEAHVNGTSQHTCD
ncbi:hypothetical protein DFJ58DRAFT_791313 [Suillus subalutaceus]|uniref:uncharacterized protein n=1 Tax=Suillus subalutaceus TaxID=48586 RepID=UPI001B866E84|nr:uncharacterized protein DFJ58DRAFT_791313 [Suillus subalutaceus]KAG1852251.1 hypothetical protein DFJ58DRAFT_791313 [Suillus subalutaceus]